MPFMNVKGILYSDIQTTLTDLPKIGMVDASHLLTFENSIYLLSAEHRRFLRISSDSPEGKRLIEAIIANTEYCQQGGEIVQFRLSNNVEIRSFEREGEYTEFRSIKQYILSRTIC